MSTAYLLERAVGELAAREQIVDVVLSHVRESENQFSGVRQRLPRLYDMWRGVWTGRFHPHKNNIHIPLIYSAIWADAARKAQTSLGMWPIVTFQGYGPDDMPIARKWESLISAQMKDMDMFMKEVDTFVTADLYGVAIKQLGWRRDKSIRIMEDIRTAPISNQLIRTIRKGPVVTFDGPDSEMVDRLDFYPQTGVARVRDMDRVARRRFLDLDKVRLLTQAGMFDKAELDRMIREGGVNSASATDLAAAKRFSVRTGMDDESARYLSKYSRPVEIIEYWGLVPSELCPDGDTMRVITIANKRYVLRNRPLPFWHKRLPFVTFSPTPDPHYFDAPGKAEVAEKVNIVANRYINQSLDSADLIVDPPIFYDRAANLNTRNMYLKPGRMFGVDGNPNEVIGRMQTDLAHLSVADNKIGQMRELAQMATGLMEDVGQGMDGPDRETARGMMMRREAQGTRLMLESRIYDEMYLESFGNMMVALDRQFLEGPVEVMILGDSATLDPVTNQQIQATRTSLDDRDLCVTYTARAQGATSSLSKSMKQQNLIQLLTAMSATPQVFGAINQINFWRGMFREFEIPNINEIFMQTPQLSQMVGMAGAEQPGQVPTSGQMTSGSVPLPGMQGVAPGMDMSSMIPPQQ